MTTKCRPGVGQLGYGWRASVLRPAHTVTIEANYGTEGSLSDYRRRQTDVIIAPPDPRFRRWNSMLSVLFRPRVANTAEVEAVAAPVAPTSTKPLNFTAPRGASLHKS